MDSEVRAVKLTKEDKAEIKQNLKDVFEALFNVQQLNIHITDDGVLSFQGVAKVIPDGEEQESFF